MEKKNTGLIVIIVVMALIIGALGGYIVSNKLINKEPNQSENNDNNNNNDSKTEDKQFKLSDTYELPFPGYDTLGILHGTVKILDSKNMIFITRDVGSEVETTKGTYEIVGNTLKYTRKYVGCTGCSKSESSNNYFESTSWIWVGNENWDSFDWKEKEHKSWIYELYDAQQDTLEFTIDKINNTLTLTNYDKTGDLVLKGVPADTQYKLKNKYSVISNKLGELRMTIELKDNNEVEITSGDGATVIEQTKGTYQVKNGKLIVTRKYYLESTESGDVWQKFTAETLKSFGLTATEEFTIDKINNQLKLSMYGRFSNIVLK